MPQTLPNIVEAIARAGHVPGERLLEIYTALDGDERAFVQRAVELTLVQEAVGYQLWAEALGLEFENPEPSALDPEALALLPEDLAKRFRAVPLRIESGTVVVAMGDPFDLPALDAIQEHLGLEVFPVVSPPSTLAECLEQRSRAGRGIDGLLAKFKLDDNAAESVFANPQRLREIAGDDAVIKLVEHMIEQAIRRKASDLHLEPGRENLRLRYRIDGRLETVRELPAALHAGLISRIKVLANLDIAERRRPQDGRFRHALSDGEIEFRVSTLPAVRGEKAVLRVLDKRSVELDLDTLGYTDASASNLGAAVARPNGLVLVTGPTGSGKTTTLYALLSTLDSEQRNIVSVEDPVEYELDGLTQVQVDSKAERTFAGALRSILRQDPDVVMIGEIRDHETAEIAVHAALTGHMVLSTLHTNSALGTITRLVDMGIAGYLIAPTLTAIVAQRLIRRLCKACSEPAEVPAGVFAELAIEPVTGDFRRAVGCSACRNRGYSGRLVMHEVLQWSPELQKALARGVGEAEIGEIARRQGFQPMLHDGIVKAAAGLTALEEVLAAVRV